MRHRNCEIPRPTAVSLYLRQKLSVLPTATPIPDSRAMASRSRISGSQWPWLLVSAIKDYGRAMGIRIEFDPDDLRPLVRLVVAEALDRLEHALNTVRGLDEGRERRLRAPRNAPFAGQKPPEDKGLLIDSKEAAKLLKISEKTLWTMRNEGRAPQPIRIGNAVRYSYEELRAWVNAGGPPLKDWKWPQRG